MNNESKAPLAFTLKVSLMLFVDTATDAETLFERICFSFSNSCFVLNMGYISEPSLGEPVSEETLRSNPSGLGGRRQGITPFDQVYE